MWGVLTDAQVVALQPFHEAGGPPLSRVVVSIRGAALTDVEVKMIGSEAAFHETGYSC
jgi:hypothetical protein